MIKNPKSGETMMIGEKHKVHFKPGLDLTLKVKKGSEK
jgi:nucleoid DNA-binding protein